MMAKQSLVYFVFFVFFVSFAYAQEEPLATQGVLQEGSNVTSEETATIQTEQEIIGQDVQAATKAEKQQASTAGVSDEVEISNITLDFKDADIRSVLKIISLKTGVNIVASPEVTGTVSVYLDNTPWDKALEIILSTYGFGYERKANIIMVAPLEKLTEQKRLEQELAQVQPTSTEVFHLTYIDALDAKRSIDPLLSPRGRITVLEVSGKAGWKFTGDTARDALGKREREKEGRNSLTKMLLITEIPPILDQIKTVLKKIDIKPKQIMIEAKILEVSRDYLEDIGFEYTTGDSVASPYVFADSNNAYQVGGNYIQGQGGSTALTPSIFTPLTTGLSPSTAGLQLAIKKILGTKFETIFTALTEDVNTNLLSAPRILTLDNQEATILVGSKYPILKTTESESTTSTQESLDYYQAIGIQLNVVPQISGENQINMIIHPAVTSFTQTVGTNQYPIITTREAETQVLMGDGETIVIGGLIKDNVKTGRIGVPLLSDIPFLGTFFSRDTEDLEKIELLIFITARIIDEAGFSDAELVSFGREVVVPQTEIPNQAVEQR